MGEVSLLLVVVLLDQGGHSLQEGAGQDDSHEGQRRRNDQVPEDAQGASAVLAGVETDAIDELEESEDREADHGNQVDGPDAVLERAALETEVKERAKTGWGLLLATPLLLATVGSSSLLLATPLLLGLRRLLGRTPGCLLVPVLHVLLGGVLLARDTRTPIWGGRDGLLGLGVPILRRGHRGLVLCGCVPILGCGLDGGLILRLHPPILGGLLRRCVPILGRLRVPILGVRLLGLGVPILGAGPLVVRHGAILPLETDTAIPRSRYVRQNEAMCPSQFNVDLAAIDANLALASERNPGRAVLLPVKANAYGHGIVPVARHVESVGSAQWLGVAEVSEAEQLREGGVELPALKFSPCFPEELDRAIAAHLTISVGDAVGVRAAQEAAERADVRHPVHLKIDTGMRRVGVHPGDAVALATQIKESSNLILEGVFTHLPISDCPEGEEFTKDQLARFIAVVDEIRDAVGEIPYVHAGNSGAVLGHDLTGTNLIRPGIIAYGYRADSSTAWEGLSPAGTWTSRISFLKRVPKGETVGYGRTWTAPRDTWIATVPVGYGDGYSRLFSNRGRMLVGGRSCPIAGRVCMDQTMIDLGPDDPQVAVGDEVVLLGRQGDEQITMEELADLMGTITYEVPCLIAPRVLRIYS